MTRDQILVMKSRLGSISPRKMQDIRACSEAAYKILADLPGLIDYADGRLTRQELLSRHQQSPLDGDSQISQQPG